MCQIFQMCQIFSQPNPDAHFHNMSNPNSKWSQFPYLGMYKSLTYQSLSLSAATQSQMKL